VVSNFYEREIAMWAGFGLVGSTEKKLGPIMSNFLEWFLMFSWEKGVICLGENEIGKIKFCIYCFSTNFFF
jgi:hypothetical protein